MRAVVSRFTSSGSDPDGHATGSRADEDEAIPCWLYSEREEEARGDEVNVARETFRLLVPVAADITEDDEISRVEDRNGSVLDGHRFRITADRRIAWSHRELVLEVLS